MQQFADTTDFGVENFLEQDFVKL